MNVLLITSEQHHHRALGSRMPVLRTPALDRLAAGGLQFDRAYCGSPGCAPSRATILTGWYPAWHGCWAGSQKLPQDVPTVSGLLNDLGYATSLIGTAQFAAPAVSDLDFWRRWTGPHYGFEHVELSPGPADSGQHYALWLEEKGVSNRRRHLPAGNLPAELHPSAWTAERTIAAIEAAVLSGRPFFCWASFPDPPNPERRTETAEADRAITRLDKQIGRILDRLDVLGVARDTLVVFTSDHGHRAGPPESGAVHHEDLVRVPLVVRWPGRVPAGVSTSALHTHVDLAPSMLNALGIPVPGQMQGQSQLAVWQGERDRVRDHVIVEQRDPGAHLRSYVEDDYKITIYRGRNRGALFDLADDPQEQHDRFDNPAYADVKSALLHRFLDAELRREPTRDQEPETRARDPQ